MGMFSVSDQSQPVKPSAAWRFIASPPSPKRVVAGAAARPRREPVVWRLIY